MNLPDPGYGLRRLKARVPIAQVLAAHGLLDTLRPCGNDALTGPCPLHGGDNPTAFRVQLARGLWHCFTACGGGDTVELTGVPPPVVASRIVSCERWRHSPGASVRRATFACCSTARMRPAPSQRPGGPDRPQGVAPRGSRRSSRGPRSAVQ